MQNNIRERLEKTRAQLKTWSTEAIEELQVRQKELSQKRDEVLRQGTEAFDTGLGTVFGAEATVLETARGIISRARTGLGGRADFLKRGEDALTEALVALRAGHRATLPIAEFDGLSVKKAVALLDGLDFNDLRTLRAYEEANKDRKTLLAELDKRIKLASPTTEQAEVAEA
jgi:DNA-binding transcriptional MerR regulator